MKSLTELSNELLTWVIGGSLPAKSELYAYANFVIKLTFWKGQNVQRSERNMFLSNKWESIIVARHASGLWAFLFSLVLFLLAGQFFPGDTPSEQTSRRVGNKWLVHTCPITQSGNKIFVFISCLSRRIWKRKWYDNGTAEVRCVTTFACTSSWTSVSLIKSLTLLPHPIRNLI